MKKLFSEIPYIRGERIVLKAVTLEDAPNLKELTDDPVAYRLLPTFLFEKKYDDVTYVIEHLYDECIKDSMILGVYLKDELCGLAELYGYRDELHKISVGCRLLRRFWGMGIGTEAVGLLVDYLYNETDIEIIAASSMIENSASARMLMKNGFTLVVHAADEDWGYGKPNATDKWIR